MSCLEHMHADIVVQHEACCTYAGEGRTCVSVCPSGCLCRCWPSCLQRTSQLLRVLFVPWDQDHTIVDYVKDKVAGAFGTAEDTSESAAAQAAAAKEAVHKCGCKCYSC